MTPQELIDQKVNEAVKLLQEAEKIADENALSFEIYLGGNNGYYGTGNGTLESYAEINGYEPNTLEGRWISSDAWC